MRRVAIRNADGSLYRFESGRPVTFKTVSEASPWLLPRQKLTMIDVPDDWEDALVSGPAH